MLKKLALAAALVATSAVAQENTDISGANFQSGKADAALATLGRKAAASGSRLVITAPKEWHAKIAAKVRAGGKADLVLRDGFYETVLVRVEDKSAVKETAAAPEPDRARVEAQRSRAEVEKAKAETEAARAEAETAKAEAEKAKAEAEAAKAAAEKASAEAAAAKARAKARHKLLLVDLGGNWCPDCRVLAGVMALPEVRAFVAAHYEVVMVDVGKFDRNGQVAAHWGVMQLKGVPAVLVVDPKTDRLVNRDRLFALADARTMTPQALADWLAQWV